MNFIHVVSMFCLVSSLFITWISYLMLKTATEMGRKNRAGEWKFNTVLFAVLSVISLLPSISIWVWPEYKVLVVSGKNVNVYESGIYWQFVNPFANLQEWPASSKTIQIYETNPTLLEDGGNGLLLSSVKVDFSRIDPSRVLDDLKISSSQKFEMIIVEQIRSSIYENSEIGCEEAVRRSIKRFQFYGLYLNEVSYCYR